MDTTEQTRTKVVIVDDMTDTRENIEKLLSFASDIEIVGQAANAEQAFRVIATANPDVVLMDISMPGTDGIKAAEILHQRWPSIRVVMMSVLSESDYLRQAMVAGAKDFLVKPFSADDLIQSVRRAAALQQMPEAREKPRHESLDTPMRRQSRGEVIAVMGPKAGVGASFVATNLACSLVTHKRKYRVAIVDGNLEFGDVGLLLDVQGPKSIVDLASRFPDVDSDLVDSIMTVHSSGLRVLLAPPRPEMAEMVRADAIKAILAKLRELFDFVIVDTWPSFQESALAILDNSDLILTVLVMEIPAVKNTKLFLEVADALEYPKDKVALVLNRSDSGGGIAVSDLEKTLGRKVVMQLRNERRDLVAQSVNRGVPLAISQRKCKFAVDIDLLAKWIISKTNPQAADENGNVVRFRTPHKGIFGSLPGFKFSRAS